MLASASPDQTVRLWDTVNHSPMATMAEHGNQARTVAFSPDGQTLASAGHDRTIARHSNKCLDVLNAATTDGAQITQWTCGTSTNQQWQRRQL